MTVENMDDNTAGTTESDSTSGTNTQGGKTFTQDELNAIVTKRVTQEQKRFEGIDLEEYRELKSLKEAQETEKLMKREEFDKLLKQTKEKSDMEINTLRGELEKTKIDGALLNAASKLKTTNPDHIAKLLKNAVKLDEKGAPIVLDDAGSMRYNSDTAEPFTIENLVEEFVNANPYFRVAGKSGTGSQGNPTPNESKEFDLSTLDLTRAEDRKIYSEMKKQGKI